MAKILIADDSMFMRKILKDIVGEKHEVIEAATGQEAEEMIKSGKPDLTLLDIIMPEGEEEGLRVLEVIRKIDPEAKVIMITAIGQDAIVEQCKKLGAVDYIVKPFDTRQVASAIKKHLG